MRITLTVNGRPEQVEVAPQETLLDVLREKLFLTGTKDCCREGECGACTVLIDNKPVDACIYAAGAAANREVETIEGLRVNGELNDLQAALVKHGATQCGFCSPGVVMMLTSLLRQNESPNEDMVKESLSGNICRCTGYSQIVDAVMECVYLRERD